MIYLLIATEGEYSDKTTWIVEAFTDEAAAVEEAARLNVASREAVIFYEDYSKRREKLLEDMAEGVLAEESRSAQYGRRYMHLSNAKREALDLRIEAQIGRYPEDDGDIDYTVVAVPIGERGKWELP